MFTLTWIHILSDIFFGESIFNNLLCMLIQITYELCSPLKAEYYLFIKKKPPDVSLRLALSIWIWVRYRENTWHTHTEKDTEPTIYRSPQCDTRSGLRSGKIKGMVTVYNKTIKILCFNRSYHIVIEDVWNSLAKARGHNGFSLSLKLPYVYYI